MCVLLLLLLIFPLSIMIAKIAGSKRVNNKIPSQVVKGATASSTMDRPGWLLDGLGYL